MKYNWKEVVKSYEEEKKAAPFNSVTLHPAFEVTENDEEVIITNVGHKFTKVFNLMFSNKESEKSSSLFRNTVDF